MSVVALTSSNLFLGGPRAGCSVSFDGAFLRFPPVQWRALRTANALERINEEFRGRTKTQAMLPSADAVLLLKRRWRSTGCTRSKAGTPP